VEKIEFPICFQRAYVYLIFVPCVVFYYRCFRWKYWNDRQVYGGDQQNCGVK